MEDEELNPVSRWSDTKKEQLLPYKRNPISKKCPGESRKRFRSLTKV
jgi:hypothetical protein